MSTLTDAIVVAKAGDKSVVRTVEFLNHSGYPFGALRDAEHWLEGMQMRHGSMCYDEPMGIVKMENTPVPFVIPKWKNISREAWKHLDGVVISEDFRNAKVVVVLFL